LQRVTARDILLNYKEDKKMIEILLNTKQASEILGVTVKSLANSRYTGIGIQVPYIKMGKLIRYKESVLEKYIDDHTFNYTSEAKEN
jgi:hypothetical protein|tara:strand:+ start:65 stop:325 length:261 start_codon:yes stop_codon:yes gene_type:complete